MTDDERQEFERQLAALKLEGETLRKDLARNMNALTLKLDIIANELKEGRLRLTANVNHLTGTVSKLADFIP